MQQSHIGRFRPRYVGLAAALCILAAAALLAGALLARAARRELINTLRERYRADVQVRSLDLSFFPYPRAVVKGVVFRKGTDVPPLVTVRRIDAHMGWMDLLRTPRRVRDVRLEGLEIRIARGRGKDAGPDAERERPNTKSTTSLLIDRIAADGTLLQILPRKSGKPPLEFDIHTLALHSVGVDRPMRFRAHLRNAKPPGLIQAEGDFGPWNAGDEGLTPVRGSYVFSKADLGVFRGISGTLSSAGQFNGRLDRIEVTGQTDTPDFTVLAGAHPVHLTATFSSTVDGTDGDTLLHPVTATFGDTTVVARGGIEGTPGVRGKTVSLDSTVRDGNLADILRLGVKSDPPPMTGAISFHSKIVIPPGDRDIGEKLHLDGAFDIASGKFTSGGLQEKVSSLSERAQGNPEDAGRTSPISQMRGKFC